MKISLEEIQRTVNELSMALTHAKEAHRVAKKVYGDEKEVSTQLKYAHAHARNAIRILEKSAPASAS